MKISPYIHFNGNCAEALAFYEHAFGIKAETSYYRDSPPSAGYQIPAGTENYVMHAHMKFGNDVIMFCDLPPSTPVTIGNNIAISISLENSENVLNVYNKLKLDGKAGMEPQETFWSNCFASLEDKFGIGWMLSFDKF